MWARLPRWPQAQARLTCQSLPVILQQVCRSHSHPYEAYPTLTQETSSFEVSTASKKCSLLSDFSACRKVQGMKPGGKGSEVWLHDVGEIA